MHRRLIEALAPLGASVVVASVLVVAAPAAGAATSAAGCGGTATVSTAVRQDRFLGVVPQAVHGATGSCAAVGLAGTRPAQTASAKFHSKPPLVDSGGPVMGAPSAGDVTITPIYWGPGGSFDAGYQSIVDQYLSDVGHDSGQLTNVYSVALQLGIGYAVTAGSPLTDTQAYPLSGCTPDSRTAYSDGSQYDACLTDAQLQTELSRFLTAAGLPEDLAHLYLVMLPKGVESCFNSGSGAGSNCTTPWVAGFCAYHSFFQDNLGNGIAPLYADMPFPTINVHFGCAGGVGSGAGFSFESPNGNLDADSEVSLVSHEVNEAITDPLGTAWFDTRGAEIGDECAYIYGNVQGATTGAQWNQVINGHQYFTQEEASNEDYTYAKKNACVQAVDLPLVSFKVSPAAPKAGPTHLVHFNAKKSEAGAPTYTWDFGDGSPTVTGTSSILRTMTHAYPVTGGVASYTVTLTIADDINLQHTSASMALTIDVTG